MFTPDQIKEIEKIFDTKTVSSFQKRVGDTPTDALQLVNKKYIDALFFYGYIASSGDPVSLPSGWTSVRNAPGDYTVTHNLGLGTNGYSVVGNIASNDTRAVSFLPSSNSFKINVGNIDNTGKEDYSVMFVLGRFSL